MRRSIVQEPGHDEALREALDQLRLEVEALRASRKRLVLAADADRRLIERDLHDGVQQHLVALAVDLQLAEQSADADPASTKALLAELGRHVEHALDEAAQLAQRIYPPLLETGGLVVALRSAAASFGIPASVEVTASARCPREVAAVVYWCWLEVLEHAGAGAQATITVRAEGGALAFEVVAEGGHLGAELEPLRDRVEALGGRLTARSEPGAATRLSGSIPISG